MITLSSLYSLNSLRAFCTIMNLLSSYAIFIAMDCTEFEN